MTSVPHRSFEPGRAGDERGAAGRASAVADFAESLGILVRYALGLDYLDGGGPLSRPAVEPEAAPGAPPVRGR